MARWGKCFVVAMFVAACGSSPAPSSSPVAKVGDVTISQQLFDIRVKSATTAIEQAGGGSPSSSDPMLKQIRASVMRSLIIDTVIAEEAAVHHFAATDADIDTEIATDEKAAGGADALQKQLGEAGGSMDQLRDEIRSHLNEARLEDYFAKQRADDVEQALAQGTDFATLVPQYSDDVATKDKGGSLGDLTDTMLTADDSTFSAAVRALQPHQYTTTPVHDHGGYDIVMVDGIEGTTYTVRHILVIAPNPYTVKDRPTWFTQSVAAALEGYCQRNAIQVYIDAGVQPCVTATPSPSLSPSAHP